MDHQIMELYYTQNQIANFFRLYNVQFSKLGLSPFSPSECGLLIILRKNNELIGLTGIKNGHDLFLAVNKSFQNKGLGQHLIKTLIHEVIKRNLCFITLRVEKSNFKAIHIYNKFGFKIVSSKLSADRLQSMILPLNLRGLMFMLMGRLGDKFSYIISHNHHLLNNFIFLWKKLKYIF